MAKQKKFDYFAAFEQQLVVAADEADILVETIKNFSSAENLVDALHRAHEIEQKGDEINRSILTSVATDFITPIEREDIIALAHDLDTITDNIEGIIQRFYMFDIASMHPKALEFSELILKSVKALLKSMESFREFKKIKKVMHMNDDVHQLEEHGDRLYIDAIRELYTTHKEDALYVAVWSRVLGRLEDTCDSCKTAADTMSAIMLKNA